MKKFTVILSIAFATCAMAIPQQIHAGRTIQVFQKNNSFDINQPINTYASFSKLPKKTRTKLEKGKKLFRKDVITILKKSKIPDLAIRKAMIDSDSPLRYSQKRR